MRLGRFDTTRTSVARQASNYQPQSYRLPLSLTRARVRVERICRARDNQIAAESMYGARRREAEREEKTSLCDDGY